MATTTPLAIRDAMAKVIAGLTPTVLADDRFTEHEENEPFRDWVEANPAGCFRRFSVEVIGPTSPPTVSNTDVELVNDSVIVEVAYPTAWRFGGRGRANLNAGIREDLRLLSHNVGTNGHAALAAALGAASVTVTTEGEEPIDLGPVHVGQLRLIARYYRSNV